MMISNYTGVQGDKFTDQIDYIQKNVGDKLTMILYFAFVVEMLWYGQLQGLDHH